ncbi:hypothetical protein PCK1_002747 [Pneumocystis canis]|nr:hypothetical protein PCK1_002747 [Pneumocystis canis]
MIFSNGLVQGFKKAVFRIKEWSPDERFVLCRRVLILGQNWEKIAEGVVGHDAESCKKEWEKIHTGNNLINIHQTPLTTMKFWTPTEVSKLQDSIHSYTLNETLNTISKNHYSLWDEISSKVGRSSIQCYLKWKRSLNPLIIKGPWTHSEKEILETAHKKYDVSERSEKKKEEKKDFNDAKPKDIDGKERRTKDIH